MWANAQRDGGRPAEWVHTAVPTTAVPTTGILTSATQVDSDIISSYHVYVPYILPPLRAASNEKRLIFCSK